MNGYRKLDTMMVSSPWHDTDRHDCNDGTKGPVVPVSTNRPQGTGNVWHLKCAACGEDWIETDPTKMARAWFSAGAWDGHNATDVPMSISGTLPCAWCGHGVSAVENVQRMNLTQRERMVWHPNCFELDSAGDLRKPWSERVAAVSMRGLNRIGIISEDFEALDGDQ